MTGAGQARRVVDLSHTIRAGLVTYPGMPGPEITDYLTRADAERSYGPGVTFHIGRVSMVANTGTYIDSPFHRYDDGGDLSSFTLDQLAELPARVFRFEDADERGIGPDAFADAGDLSGTAVLLQTGWDRHFGTPEYGPPAPYLTKAGVEALIAAGVTLVGIDSLNIDDTTPEAAGERPAHSLLLAAGIPVVEHLTNLSEVPESGATFTAVPPKVEAFGTFPVRAYATLRD